MKTSYISAIVIVLVVVVAAGAYYYVSTQQPAQKQFKVAAIFTTPLEEPWNNIMYQALVQAQDQLGINFTYVENVGTSDEPGVALNYINNGYNLVIPDSWGFWSSTDNLSRVYPAIYFGEGSGLSTDFSKGNLLLFDSYLQESSYVAGYVGAMVSNTSKLGVVAAYQSAGDVDDLINGFIAGARAENPSCNITVAYINSWYDPAAAQTVAQSMIASGVDVIYGEREGTFQACNVNGVQKAVAFGDYVNQNAEANTTVVGSVVWNNYPMLKAMIQGAESGNFPAGDYYCRMANNDTYFAWNPYFITHYPAAYAAAQNLVAQIDAGTVMWGNIRGGLQNSTVITGIMEINGTIASGATTPLWVPDFATPVP
ncbi:MAG: BMP family ABC transporter substrate-binding protein [Candidatus Methanomethylicaceae archaeon]|jgi:basic membrane lipoprotein Med (substrate-binding protein (PBP1-ABC) superfamily)